MKTQQEREERGVTLAEIERIVAAIKASGLSAPEQEKALTALNVGFERMNLGEEETGIPEVVITEDMRSHFLAVMRELREGGNPINEQYIDITEVEVRKFPCLAPYVGGAGYLNTETWEIEEQPMRCRSCGFYPCACGADERS